MSRTLPRVVLPELLDQLPPDDPHALRSRRDLQRIHIVMRTQSTLRGAIEQLRLARPPQSILELGAGDGTVLLQLARKLAVQWPRVELTLLDRHDLISSETRAAFLRLGWRVSVLEADVLAWARAPAVRHHDLCLATLFLHHFAAPQLTEILTAVAARSTAFVACEPRRDLWAQLGSRLVGLIGGNSVTREDAVTSVAAGFAGCELREAWPGTDRSWIIEESPAFPFTHRFSARRRDHLPAGADA
jgi:hypothetical protein